MMKILIQDTIREGQLPLLLLKIFWLAIFRPKIFQETASPPQQQKQMLVEERRIETAEGITMSFSVFQYCNVKFELYLITSKN